MGVTSFQKIYGLYSVEHHKLEKWSYRVGCGWVLWVWWVCVVDGWVDSGSVLMIPTIHRWIVGIISFQKMYGLKHDIVEISGDVTDAGGTDKQQRKIVLLSFWSVRNWVLQFIILMLGKVSIRTFSIIIIYSGGCKVFVIPSFNSGSPIVFQCPLLVMIIIIIIDIIIITIIIIIIIIMKLKVSPCLKSCVGYLSLSPGQYYFKRFLPGSKKS